MLIRFYNEKRKVLITFLFFIVCYLNAGMASAQKIVWLMPQPDKKTQITDNIQQGLELSVLYLQSKNVNVELDLMSYNDLATLSELRASEIDWVILGPQSKSIEQLEYLNRIRKNNNVSELKSFVIWQDPQVKSGLSAMGLSHTIEQLMSKTDAEMFADQFRLWQSHVNLTSQQESVPTKDFATFIFDACELNGCEDVFVYPFEFQQLLTAMSDSNIENFAKLKQTNINWVLINATLEQTMQFSGFDSLYLVSFYHYQQRSNETNNWLIENYLTQHQSAPNQYVALGFQSVLQLNQKTKSEPVLSVIGNRLIWQKHQVKFQKGWPVLNVVEMN